MIIGGGLAGVKAAHTIASNQLIDPNNPKINFKLLEWADHLGGRIHSINFAGRVLEEGANWVSGKVGPTGMENPVWNLA